MNTLSNPITWIVATVITLIGLAACEKPSHAVEYNPVVTPIAGQVVEYIRFPAISISNPHNGVPRMEFVNERASIYPHGKVLTEFVKRTSLAATDYPVEKIPLLSPVDGSLLGYFTSDQFYAMSLSLAILADKRSDGLVRVNAAKELCYVTSKDAVDCQ